MMWVLIAIIIAIVLMIWGLASYESSHAAAVQAQAAIEASRATQIAASGQAIVSVLLAVIILLLVVIVAMGCVVWLRSKQMPTQHRHTPAQQHPIGQISGESLTQLQQVLMLQLMARLIQPVGTISLPQPQSAELDEDENLPWWE
jgi:hypothetical protein